MQHKHETAMEYMRRIVENLNYEPESILDSLPSVQAIVEYFELWDVYDTEYLSSILYGITEDDENPKPLQDFIEKWNLPWTIPGIRV